MCNGLVMHFHGLDLCYLGSGCALKVRPGHFSAVQCCAVFTHKKEPRTEELLSYCYPLQLIKATLPPVFSKTLSILCLSFRRA